MIGLSPSPAGKEALRSIGPQAGGETTPGRNQKERNAMFAEQEQRLNIKYLGIQEGFGRTSDMHLFLDEVTKSTFAAADEAGIEKGLTACRKRFGAEA
jgi:hypothetical protein